MSNTTEPRLAELREHDLRGRLLKGRYELREVLGHGSSGVVYSSFDRLSRSDVAVKILPAHLRKDPVAAGRINREMRVAFSLRHDHLVSMLDSVVEDEYVFLILERVIGSSLAEMVNPKDQLPVHECIRLLRQIAQALRALHRNGIIHRDLKPENVLVNESGQVMVTDFGVVQSFKEVMDLSVEELDQHRIGCLAFMRQIGGERLTESGSLVGTPEYLSPEYIETAQCDLRSDLYALGIIAYELITGHFPYDESELYRMLAYKLEEDPDPPEKLRPDCPEELSRICMKLLARNPQERYQNADQLLVDLNSFEKETGPASRSSRVAVQLLGLASPDSEQRKRRIPILSIILLVLIFLGLYILSK